ncbi:hypothetical protein QUH71_26895 (plasmid) [Priestia aryabhattai]|uniref:hypothetical protein n=1 Tax=Priestia aryabhattai TaxID=412384 RepID=UPI0025A3F9AB|nr:hypothetical protein [Priestia aryabhattai]WJN47595.1 hypothetical protein QUH71_26895 [Priestia aryabhattai]
MGLGLGALFSNIAVGIITNAVYDEIMDGDIVEAKVLDSYEKAKKRFIAKYGDEFGGDIDSFLERQGNIDKVIKSMFLDVKNITVEEIDPRAFNGKKDATTEAIDDFLEFLKEELLKDFTLNRIFTEKQFIEESREFRNDVREEFINTRKKIGGIRRYLTTVINRGFEKLKNDIGKFDIALNPLQSGWDYPPPLSQVLLKRDISISNDEKHMHHLTWFHLYGEVSTGKTHYLHLLSEKIPGKKIWIKCKGLNNEQVNSAIKFTLAEVAKKNINNGKNSFDIIVEKLAKGTVLIIDDIPQLKANDILVNNLNQLHSACEKHGVKILSSSTVKLTQGLTKYFNKNSYLSVQVPPLLVEDIIELICVKNSSLEDKEKIAYWIGALTKYNPALVAACVDYLDLKSWEITNEVYESLQKGLYSADLNEEVRDLLLEEIKNTDTKELLYRLSLINSEFDNRYIEEICNIQPTIIHPADKLRELEGYWVQKTNTGYRISPLVEKISISNLHTNTLKEVHSSIAKVIRQSKVLSPTDFIKMFSHLCQAEEFNNAALALYNVLFEFKKEELTEDYWGITSIWYNMPLPEGINKNLRLLLRAKQIVACLKFKKDVTYLVNDFKKMKVDKEDELSGAIYLSLALELLNYDENLSMNFLKNFYLQSDEKSLEEFFGTQFLDKQEHHIEEIVWWYCLGLKNSRKNIEMWLDILISMSSGQRERAFKSELSYNSCLFFTENIWLSEVKLPRKERDWQSCLDLLNMVKEVGLKINEPILYSCAIRNLIIIYFEYLSLKEEGLKLYKEALTYKHNDESLFLLHSIVGKQFIYTKEYTVAIDFLKKAIDLNSSKYPFVMIDALVFMAKCREGVDAIEVKEILNKAIEIESKQEISNVLIRVKLLGELGIHYFNENQYNYSYNYFKDAINSFHRLKNKDEEWKSTFVILSHVLGYISTVVSTGEPPLQLPDGDVYAKPTLGMIFSENENRHRNYDIRKYMHINTIMGLFARATNDIKEEFYWLNQAMIDIEENNFKNVLGIATKKAITPHYILRQNFKNAIKNGIDYPIELAASMFKYEEDILENLNTDPILRDEEKFKQVIEASIIAVFLPLMFYVGKIKATKNEDFTKHASEIIRIVEELQVNYISIPTWNIIKNVFKMTFLENHTVREFLEVSQAYSSTEKVLYYVGASIINTSKKEALEIHLKIVSYLYKSYNNERFTFSSIVVPFFKSYWMHSYITNRFDFKNVESIDKELEGILKESDINSLKLLLKLMNSGLCVEVPSDILEFLNS